MKMKYLLMLVEARAFLHELKCGQHVNKPGGEKNSTYNIIKVIFRMNN